jgi:hypothetical protein
MDMKDMMKYNEEFRFEEGVLHIRLSGKFPNELLDKWKNCFQPLIDACSAHNCKKTLIDARDLQVNFSTMEMYKAGQDAASATRVGLRIAILARKDMIDPFFDDVVHNYCGPVGIFMDMDTARDRLQKWPQDECLTNASG